MSTFSDELLLTDNFFLVLICGERLETLARKHFLF